MHACMLIAQFVPEPVHVRPPPPPPVPTQQPPRAQVPSSQHVSPGPPQSAQTPGLPTQISPAAHVRPGQHACPGPPIPAPQLDVFGVPSTPLSVALFGEDPPHAMPTTTTAKKVIRLRMTGFSFQPRTPCEHEAGSHPAQQAPMYVVRTPAIFCARALRMISTTFDSTVRLLAELRREEVGARFEQSTSSRSSRRRHAR
jgi:hypothetical protein